MQKLNKLKSKLLIILCVFQISCAKAPPDIPVCGLLKQYMAQDENGHMILKPSPACMSAINESECLHCTNVVSGKETFVGEVSPHFLNGKSMTQIIEESIYVPAVESYAPLSAYIINECKLANCSDKVDRFKVKVDVVTPPQPISATPPATK